MHLVLWNSIPKNTVSIMPLMKTLAAGGQGISLRPRTVTFAKSVSKKASSSARLASTSSSAERLIRIVNAFFAIGYMSISKCATSS